MRLQPPAASAWTEGRASTPVVRSDRRPRLPWLVTGAGISIVVAIGLIAIFLLVQAIPSLRRTRRTSSRAPSSTPATRRTSASASGTSRSSPPQLCLRADPRGPGRHRDRALLDQYAPRSCSPESFGVLVDLLAAVPSIVFGLWGIFVLAPGARAVRELPQRRRWAGFRSSPTATSRSPAGEHLHGIGRARHHDPADRHRQSPARYIGQTPRSHIEAAIGAGSHASGRSSGRR